MADLTLGLLAIICHIGRVLGSVVASVMFFTLYLDYMPTIIERWVDDPPDKLVTDSWALFLLTVGCAIGSVGLGWAVWRATGGMAAFPDKIAPKGWVRPPRPVDQPSVDMTWATVWREFRQASGLRLRALLILGVALALAGLLVDLAGVHGWYWPLVLSGAMIGGTAALAIARCHEERRAASGPDSTEERER